MLIQIIDIKYKFQPNLLPDPSLFFFFLKKIPFGILHKYAL